MSGQPKKTRKSRGVAPIDWAMCGTSANYQRHRKLGETPCDACRLAHNSDRWAYKLAKKERENGN